LVDKTKESMILSRQTPVQWLAQLAALLSRLITPAPQPAAQHFDTAETFSIADAPPSAAVVPNTPFGWLSTQARNAVVLVFINDATSQISKLETMSHQQLATFLHNPLYTSDASCWVAGRHGALQRADFDTDSTFRQQETVVANLEELLGARAYVTNRLTQIDAAMLDLVAIALPPSPPQGARAMAASVNAKVTLATLMTERKSLSAELADIDAHILPVLHRLGVRPPAAQAGDHSKRTIISTVSGQQEGGLPFA
jgi:hypothetical protein